MAEVPRSPTSVLVFEDAAPVSPVVIQLNNLSAMPECTEESRLFYDKHLSISGINLINPDPTQVGRIRLRCRRFPPLEIVLACHLDYPVYIKIPGNMIIRLDNGEHVLLGESNLSPLDNDDNGQICVVDEDNSLYFFQEALARTYVDDVDDVRVKTLVSGEIEWTTCTTSTVALDGSTTELSVDLKATS